MDNKHFLRLGTWSLDFLLAFFFSIFLLFSPFLPVSNILYPFSSFSLILFKFFVLPPLIIFFMVVEICFFRHFLWFFSWFFAISVLTTQFCFNFRFSNTSLFFLLNFVLISIPQSSTILSESNFDLQKSAKWCLLWYPILNYAHKLNETIFKTRRPHSISSLTPILLISEHIFKGFYFTCRTIWVTLYWMRWDPINIISDNQNSYH